MGLLFPFELYWPFYLGFVLFVLGLLVLDLKVFHKEAHKVSFKEAGIWTGVWIGLALLFDLGLYYYCHWDFPRDARLLAMPGFEPEKAATRVALEFLSGFVVEKSLAVDNLFVFIVIFSYFNIPAKYQHRVLYYGILGALVFRAIFIALGSVLMQYKAVILFFGAFLIFTGFKMMFGSDKKIQPEKNPLLRLMKKFLPVSPHMDNEHFFVRLDGVLHATPLLVTLLVLEVTDIIFALDSVPAIFALTKEPFIVFTSNIFAILGLRALFFLLAGVVDLFHYLKYGLALVLIFVGLKMTWLNDVFDGHFPIGWSLGIIGMVLAISIAASLLFPPKAKK